MVVDTHSGNHTNAALDAGGFRRRQCYSVIDGSKKATLALAKLLSDQVPDEILQHLQDVILTTSTDGTQIYFPCPFKETEATVALKSVEASVVAAIADLRYSNHDKRRKIEVDLEKAATFLFSTYIATIGGLGKQDPHVKAKLKQTDLNKAQSILYRRLSANLYETKNPGEYYHIHGSLEASKTLNMIGLEAHRPDLTDYRECLHVIESHVKQFTASELDKINLQHKQAGVQALNWDQFKQTLHGKTLLSKAPFELTKLLDSSPPCPFTTPASLSTSRSEPQPLSGIRVLELCRIIAGPAMGRTLSEYGAQVLKVTCSSTLPDVPFFQVDGNTGKHCCDINLKTPSGRQTFESLLQTADVILDGYRPGALAKLGYSPQQLANLVKGRGRGIVYVSEDCFGAGGDMEGRAGWQQIADCFTGVAWAQGEFMGLEEPVVPPFPMSDYGTGCLGAVAVLTGLYRRATEGGSWVGRTSLCQYDVFLMGLGLYGKDVREKMRREHDAHFFELRHNDSVDEVGGRALKTMKRVHPELFDTRLMQKAYSEGFKEEVSWCKSPVSVEGLRVGFERASRPNGFDEPSWEGWEIERAVFEG